jgi:hypothetical protein
VKLQSTKRPSAKASALKGSVFFAGSLAILSLGACSQEGSVKYESGGMTQTLAEGKAAVPKDFVLPVYPGATATGSVSAEGSGQEQSKFLMLSSPDSLDKVSDYYQNTLKDKGWTIDKVDTDAPKVVSISAHMKETEANVMLADDGGKTTISLSSGIAGDTSKDDTESNQENYKPDKANPPTD